MPPFGAGAMAGGIMTKHLKAAVLGFGLAMSLLPGPLSATQQKKPAHPAPIPAQILTAKKVFIANGGGGGKFARGGGSTPGGPTPPRTQILRATLTSGALVSYYRP